MKHQLFLTAGICLLAYCSIMAQQSDPSWTRQVGARAFPSSGKRVRVNDYGAAKDGWDGHNYYGRYAEFSGHNFEQHLIPFTGAFVAHVGGVMPTYSILQNVTIDGNSLEQVGAGFNRQLTVPFV